MPEKETISFPRSGIDFINKEVLLDNGSEKSSFKTLQDLKEKGYAFDYGSLFLERSLIFEKLLEEGLKERRKETITAMPDSGWEKSSFITLQDLKEKGYAFDYGSLFLERSLIFEKLLEEGLKERRKETITAMPDSGWEKSSFKTPQDLKEKVYAFDDGLLFRGCFPGSVFIDEEMFNEMLLDGGLEKSIFKTLQNLKEKGFAFDHDGFSPKLPFPGCFRGLYSSFGMLLQRVIPGYQQEAKKIKEESWRVVDSRILPEVLSQGHFGTCVFFAVIGAIEARYRLYAIRSNADHMPLPQLSKQDLIDGTGKVSIHPAACFKWIIEHGVVPEISYPYTGVPGGVHVLEENRISVVTDYRFINPEAETPENIVAEIMQGGPIVGILLYGSQYKHAVMLIGGVYKNDHVDQYVIQNSWGTEWEENGRGFVPTSSLIEAYVPILG